jgi:hypothetical protein
VSGIASVTAAAVGTVIAFSLLLWPVFQRWVFSSTAGLSADGSDLALSALACFVGFAVGMALAGEVMVRIAARLQGLSATPLVLAIAVLAFAAVLAFELSVGLTGGGGNFSGSDLGGATVTDGVVTLHGWDSAARRALAAAGVGGIMAAVFLVIRKRA